MPELLSHNLHRARQDEIAAFLFHANRRRRDKTFRFSLHQLIDECLDLPRVHKKAWNLTIAYLGQDPAADAEALWRKCLELLSDDLEIVEDLRDFVKTLGSDGIEFANAGELPRVETELRELLRREQELLPWTPSAEEIAQAHRAIEQGECRSVEEILGELQGSHS